MTTSGWMVGALLGLAAFGAFAGEAVAAQATARATGAITIYSGPGYGYAPIGRLAGNSVVTLAECTRSGRWCRIDQQPGGWVLASYLVGSAAKVEATPFKPLVNPFAEPFRFPRQPRY